LINYPLSVRRERSNSPNARTRNENHQRKYPILRSIESEPKLETYQYALRMKAEVAVHADARRNEPDPHTTTHTEPKMKRGVVAALAVGSTASYHR
jgi:hypothetical protein